MRAGEQQLDLGHQLGGPSLAFLVETHQHDAAVIHLLRPAGDPLAELLHRQLRGHDPAPRDPHPGPVVLDAASAEHHHVALDVRGRALRPDLPALLVGVRVLGGPFAFAGDAHEERQVDEVGGSQGGLDVAGFARVAELVVGHLLASL